jgi:hypothetical protein
MKSICIPLVMLSLIFSVSCEKELSDYREKYTGDFLFTNVIMSWHLDTDSSGLIQIVHYDTSEFQGFIRKFEAGDDATDLYPDPDSLYPDSTVFIQFLEQAAITTLLKPDGTMMPRGGYHYSCSGSFFGTDSVNFSVEGLGGLGAGWNYYVKGSRK